MELVGRLSDDAILPIEPNQSAEWDAAVHTRLTKSGTESCEPREPDAQSSMLEHYHTSAFDAPKQRTRVWYILAFYLPLSIVPWTVICVTKYHPVNAPNYIDPTGQLTPRDFQINENIQAAMNVMNTIAAVLTIPVTSLLLAEAAVVWLQRGDVEKGPVSLDQFFDLADRGWTDVAIVWQSFSKHFREPDPKHFAGTNRFLLAASCFIVLCSAILPLQQLLVRTENTQVITCNDTPYPLPKNRDRGFSGKLWLPRIWRR
jgi:hypothetical protein